jgi:O-antigen ligase
MNVERTGYMTVVEGLAMSILLIYPSATLLVEGGANGAFILMLLITIGVWTVRPRDLRAVVWRSEWNPYVIGMFALSIAIFISQSWLGEYDDHPFDAASRYWLAIPIFLLLHRLSLQTFAPLQYAFPVAAILGLVMSHEVEGRSGVETLDLIHFGDIELSLGVLSVMSINWLGKDSQALRWLKITGLLAGLWASIASGSRGGWLAIPLFIVLIIYFRAGKMTWQVVLKSMLINALMAVLLFAAASSVQQRLGNFSSDMTDLSQGKPDTSIGIRLQLYKAALDIFIHNPVFGVGPEGFAAQMKPMAAEGKLTEMAAYLGEGEVHNDILSKAAGMGIFGLLAILAVYLAPMRLFWQAARSGNDRVKRSGEMGFVFVSGFIVYGLTVEFLNLTMATAFYSFTVAVLLAACHNIHHGESVRTSTQGS